MRRDGFTLIELLVVIAIIGLLAGLVISAVGTSDVKAKTAVVRAMISNMEALTATYYEEVGFYPPGDAENDEGNINLMLALTAPSAADGGQGGPSSPYHDFNESEMAPSEYKPEFKVLVDPWGTPYRYRSARNEDGELRPGIHRRRTYDLWSCGPNMIDEKGVNNPSGEEDDVACWH